MPTNRPSPGPRTVALGLAALLPLAGPAPAQDAAKSAGTPAAAPSAEEDVRKVLQTFVQAYNDADPAAIAALFADNGAIVDGEDRVVEGRAALEAHYKEAFADGPTAQVSGDADTVRFPTPEVASASGHFALLDAEGEVLSEGRFGALLLKGGDGWKLAELHDESAEEAAPAKALSQIGRLAWLVGEWVNEGGDSTVETAVRWAEGGRFLVRTYSLKLGGETTTTGTQWIGWDPQTRQIKSWVFDSQGGHGEGLWTESEGRWIVKATGVLGDGRPTSATQVLRPEGADAIRFRSTDRIVGEEAQPDLDEVILVRRPPGPSDAHAPKPPAGADAPAAARP
jgi:uncharacterized protein (TIGR02246 family)